MPESPTFFEVQRIRQWWIWGVVGLIVVLAWWSFVQQIVLGRPFGTNPAPDWLVWGITAVCGIGAPLLFAVMRLETTVDATGLRLRFVPFRDRRVEAPRIRSQEVVAYRPIRQWGGWGIRYGFGRGWAYTASGNRGVQLELADGKRLLVGSQRPEALAAALQALAT